MNQVRLFTPKLARSLLPLFLLCMSAISLRAQTLQITSPPDGSVAYSGQALNVAVTVSGTFRFVGLLAQNPLSDPQPLTGPPYQFTIQVPNTIASGSYGITAAGITASGQIVDTDPIGVDIERMDRPLQLTTQISALHMGYAGDGGHVRVYGRFAYGSTVDLTYSSLLAYSSDTPAVATVDTNGLVTAIGPGHANIVITYPGTSIKVPVIVPGPAVIPPTFSMYTFQTFRFTAQMALPAGVDPSVTWSINPALGSIDSTGLYTPPSSLASWKGLKVTATSVADPTKCASAQVWVFPPVSVTITPPSASLSAGREQDFIARVANAAGAVKWRVTPAGVGTFQSGTGTDPVTFQPIAVGRYFAPGTITSAKTVTVTATSVNDNTKSASAQIALVPTRP
jgi:hypothetical protein